MDNFVQQTQWAPRTAGIAGCAAAGAVLTLLGWTLAADVPGRVLSAVAGLGLLAFAGLSWHARPKLAITTDGLQVRGWWQTRLLRRSDVEAIRITRFRRIGRRVRLLEIETFDDRLLVFSGWDLGAEPLEVLDALAAAGYTGR